MAVATTTEVAAMLRMTTKQVQRLAKRGDLPVVHKLPGPTGAYLFDREQIEGMMQ